MSPPPFIVMNLMREEGWCVLVFLLRWWNFSRGCLDVGFPSVLEAVPAFQKASSTRAWYGLTTGSSLAGKGMRASPHS